ncbi:TPA: mevalonate kinase [Candidatus Geothermarchaeota archaeon]|nr:mevalonate kinase [Candidatus Geothermarchaeota archaeon]HIQ13849.1 mevalonate kinase [Thermoprotei archaeon]
MASFVKASSPAKLILMGEHFVVHNSHAISTALDIHVDGIIIDDGGGYIEIEYLDHTERYDLSIDNIITRFINFLCKEYGVDRKPTLKIKYNFPVSAGLGSSASFATVATKLFHKMYTGEDPSKHVIYRFGSIFEKSVHGNPSGIDLSTVVEGGVILFKRGVGVKDRMESLNLGDTNIVVVDSGVKRSTGKLVSHVTYNLNSLPDRIREGLIDVVDSVVNHAWSSIRRGDIKSFSEAVKSNHYLLKYIGVYNKWLDRIVDDLIELGASAAKVTGAGGGGCVYGLVDKTLVMDVKRYFADRGYRVYTPKIYF